jgi:hypothetical protein
MTGDAVGYQSLANALFDRSDCYLDELAALAPNHAEEVKDLEVSFLLAAFEMTRTGHVAGLLEESNSILADFLGQTSGYGVRVVGANCFISITRQGRAFTLHRAALTEEFSSDDAAAEFPQTIR